jgi:glyoxylase-like metal-dependent hydrolase (beta-lactamase superfamily II)
MVTATRRDFVLSAAMAAVALGLDGRVAISAPCRRRRHRSLRSSLPAQQTPDPMPGFHRYKIGDAECIALYDGVWEKAHDKTFFSNATVAETKQALAAAGFTTRFVTIPITAYVIRLGGKLVLCDAGGGDQVQAYNRKSRFTSGRMLANMRAAGIDPAQIETILISHFHPDHIFGLLEKNTNAPVFPHAEIIVSAAEYKWWTDQSLICRLPAARRPLAQRIQAVIPSWKNVLPVEGEDEVVPGISFVSAPGHTPGHTAFHISSGKDQLMISSDAAYVPALCATHPGWHGAFDQDGALAEASRRKLLDRVVADGMMICGSHFPWPGLCRIARDGDGYALTVSTA